MLLYVSSAEALVRQAAVELGRPELRGLLADPSRPLPLAEAWRLLPAIVAETSVPTRTFVPESAPWPQFAELLMLETSWVYPGADCNAPRLLSIDPPRQRLRAARAPSRSPRTPAHNQNRDFDFSAHRPATRPLRASASTPRHPRGILDAAIEALDRRMGGALCQSQRHRLEPVRVIYPTPTGSGG